MSDPRKTGLAWLRTPSLNAAIKVRGRSSQPQECAFFAPDFALSESEPWLIGEEAALHLQTQPLPPINHRADPSSADFDRLHEEIIGRIRAHEFEKVVPIVCEELEFSRPLHAGMFTSAITQSHPGQF